MPDGGGEGEDALQDADDDAGWCVPAVAFEVELAFEGVVDGLDDLAQRPEELCPVPCGLALAGRAQQPQPGCGQGRLEVTAVAVLSAMWVSPAVRRAAARPASPCSSSRAWPPAACLTNLA